MYYRNVKFISQWASMNEQKILNKSVDLIRVRIIETENIFYGYFKVPGYF